MTEVITRNERDNILEEISALSFEELLKMKEQMGSKLYNKTIHGQAKSHSKTDFHRANKNRPREMSSKIRPKTNKFSSANFTPIKKVIPRDPRFDPLCGQFEDKEFKSNYKFISDIREKEKEQLEKEMKTCVNSDRKKTIQLLIQRINNQIRDQHKNESEQLRNNEEKREIRRKLQKGEKPNFKKKSVKKMESLIEKYEELKKSNKLQKHIEKRSKKLLGKSKKKMNHDEEFE
ncbi:hypothetical protein JTB14_020346 [Gonioctena quinquepunctata]|nr:hypothetical protein JTB14_020346 [Gonioctena quinquepunctata]